MVKLPTSSPRTKRMKYIIIAAVVAGVTLLSAGVYILALTFSPARYNLGDDFKYYDYYSFKCSFLCFESNPRDLSMIRYQTDLSLDEVREYIVRHGGNEELEPEVSTDEGFTETDLYYYCSSPTTYYLLNSTAEKAAYESKWNKPKGSVTHSAILYIPEHLVKHMVGTDKLCD